MSKPLQPERSKEKLFSDQSITPGFTGTVIRYFGQHSAVFTDEFRDWLFAYQDGRCGYCGDSLGDDWSGNKKAHVEHIKHRDGGGQDIPPNLMYACAECNVQKRQDHYSTMNLKIAMRRAGISGLITVRQAKTLIDMGLLNVNPLERLFFEDTDWTHIHPLPAQED